MKVKESSVLLNAVIRGLVSSCLLSAHFLIIIASFLLMLISVGS